MREAGVVARSRGGWGRVAWSGRVIKDDASFGTTPRTRCKNQKNAGGYRRMGKTPVNQGRTCWRTKEGLILGEGWEEVMGGDERGSYKSWPGVRREWSVI